MLIKHERSADPCGYRGIGKQLHPVTDIAHLHIAGCANVAGAKRNGESGFKAVEPKDLRAYPRSQHRP